MACAPVASVFAGVLRETAGAWQAYECPVGYAIDRLDVTITEATAGATLPASGVRFVLERMGGLNYRSVGIGGGGAAMVASIAVELVRVCR
jgi:hypothetical protein